METAFNAKKSLKALVGAAHHALRAHAKALEAKSGGKDHFRYHVPEDGSTGSILSADGAIVVQKPIQEWAKEGPQVRLSMIGLRSFKEMLEEAAKDAGSPMRVRFELNVLEGVARLTGDGKALLKGDFESLLSLLKVGERASAALLGLTEGEMETIGGWAKLGRHIEVDFFQSLQAAEGYGFGDAIVDMRQKGVRLGIIRRRPGSEDQSKTAPAPEPTTPTVVPPANVTEAQPLSELFGAGPTGFGGC